MLGNSQLHHELSPYLALDEEVIWIGSPTSSRDDPNRSAFSMIFLIFWLGFAVFWTVTAMATAGFMGVFGLLFVGVGIYLFYMMFIGRKKAVMHSVYAVTDRRALILADLPRKGRTCTEYIFANLPTISVENVEGTVGTIRFLPMTPPYYSYANSRHYGRRTSAFDLEHDLCSAFHMIPDVQLVHRLISERIHR